MPKPAGFFDPKKPAGEATPPERRPPDAEDAEDTPAAATEWREAGGRGQPATERSRRRREAGGSGERDARSRRRRVPIAATRLSFSNSDLVFKGNHLIVGSFHGFNTYDISNPKKPKLVVVDGLPRRPGRRLDPRQPAVHVGRADARPRRLRHRGRQADGEQRALPRRAHLRHQRSEEAEAGRGRADLPRLAHAHAGHRSPKDTGQRLHLRLRHRRGALGRGAGGLLGLDPKKDANTALFSIDVIQVPVKAPADREDRQSAAHLRRSEDRRALGPVAGRRSRPGHAAARASPISATTSPSIRTSASPRARARATASCSTSRTRRIRRASTR